MESWMNKYKTNRIQRKINSNVGLRFQKSLVQNIFAIFWGFGVLGFWGLDDEQNDDD